MTTILHLSDLHLGPPEEHQYLDDHKIPMAGGDRRAEKDVLIATSSPPNRWSFEGSRAGSESALTRSGGAEDTRPG
jgi:hypothetical protein